MRNFKLLLYMVVFCFWSAVVSAQDLDVQSIAINPNPGTVGQTTTILTQINNNSFDDYDQNVNGPVFLEFTGAAVMDLTNATLSGPDAAQFTNLTCNSNSCQVDFVNTVIPAFTSWEVNLTNIDVTAVTAAPETVEIELIFPFGTTDPDTFNFLNLDFESNPRFIQDQSGPWNVSGNWIDGVVPTANDDAIIDVGVTSTVIQNQEVRNLETRPGSLVTINDGFTLDINGDLTNNGDFEGPGFALFNGTTAQQIIGDGTDAGSFSNIRLDNALGLTVTDDIDITDVLDLDDGDVTVETNDFITLKSTSAKTAIVANTNGRDIIGCIVVERYIPPKRAMRFLSSPVNTQSAGCSFKPTINDNLQEGEQVTNRFEYTTATDGSGTMVGNPDFGTHITGFNTQTLSDQVPTSIGLDATQTGNPSMWFFNNANSNYDPVLNTKNQGLIPGQDMMIMIRGGRDMDLNISNEQIGNETVLRFTGELHTNAFAVSDLNATPSPNVSPANPVFNAVGNPYHAQVHLGNLLKDNSTGIVKSRAYVYDPTVGDGLIGGSFGGFVLLEFNPDGTLALATPSSLGSGAIPNAYLMADQSFFVENEEGGSGVSLTFDESFKSNTTSEEIAIFTSTPSNDFSVKMDLYESTQDEIRDGIYFAANSQYNDGYVQQEDALKFSNNLETFAISNLNNLFAIERRNLDDGTTEIVQLNINNYTSVNYTFKIEVNNPENKTVYLLDNYLGTQTLLDAVYNEYNFNVDQNIPASVDITRFQLIFDNTTLSDSDMALAGIEIYPNPVENLVYINKGQFSGVFKSLTVYDVTGKQVMSMPSLAQDNQLSVDMSSLASGLYILTINTSNGAFQQKLIKQ